MKIQGKGGCMVGGGVQWVTMKSSWAALGVMDIWELFFGNFSGQKAGQKQETEA